MNPDRLREILVDSFGEDHEIRHGEFKINCFRPECSDSTKNLEINLAKGIFHCWKCDYSGNIRKLFKDYLGYTPSFEDYISIEDLKIEGDIKEEKQAIKGLPDGFFQLQTNIKSMIGQKSLKYALSRMDMEDVIRHRVGYCGVGRYRWRIIIPVFEEGELVYWVARSIYKNEKDPYLYPESERGGIVFNIDGAREIEQAVITEGALDAIKVGRDGVAIFGTSLLEAQFRKLNEINNIVIMLDEDAKDKAVKIALKFKIYGKSTRIAFLPKGDPGDYTRGELREFIEHSKLFNLELEYKLLGL